MMSFVAFRRLGCAHGTVGCRNFSKKSRERFLERQARQIQEAELARLEEEKIPMFSSLIRQFYRRSHPDLLRASHPEYAQINDQSMQVLNDVLSTMKSTTETQKLLIKKVPFYLKTTGTDSVACVDLHVKSINIKYTFEKFFKDIGVSEDGKFRWDKEYFPVEVINGPRAETEKPPSSVNTESA